MASDGGRNLIGQRRNLSAIGMIDGGTDETQKLARAGAKQKGSPGTAAFLHH
jgi:hypothetical protein